MKLSHRFWLAVAIAAFILLIYKAVTPFDLDNNIWSEVFFLVACIVAFLDFLCFIALLADLLDGEDGGIPIGPLSLLMFGIIKFNTWLDDLKRTTMKINKPEWILPIVLAAVFSVSIFIKVTVPFVLSLHKKAQDRLAAEQAAQIEPDTITTTRKDTIYLQESFDGVHWYRYGTHPSSPRYVRYTIR